MKTAILLTLIAVITGAAAPRGHGGFTSLWVFGDGVCTGTQGPGGDDYHGLRYCNGRVWVELLAEWQGMSFDVADASQNNSYYGHDSIALQVSVNAFTAPPDVATAMVVIWANDADFVRFTLDETETPYDATDLPQWNALIADSIARHEAAVTTLHGKGVRTIVMPLAVDLGPTPFYNLPESDEDFIRARTIDYNTAFVAAMKSLELTLPGLKIHLPDTFSFLDDVIGTPGDFGLINPISVDGETLDAVTNLDPPNLKGAPGADYVFWDFLHPSAIVQMHLAELVQQMISPARIEAITSVGTNIELEVGNVPIGRGGFVDGNASLSGTWAEDAPIPATAVTETVVLPRTDPERYYRARFPLEWVWP